MCLWGLTSEMEKVGWLAEVREVENVGWFYFVYINICFDHQACACWARMTSGLTGVREMETVGWF